MREIFTLVDFGKTWLSVKDMKQKTRFLLIKDYEDVPYSCVPELAINLRAICEDQYMRRVAIMRDGTTQFVLIAFLNRYFSAPTFRIFNMSNELVFDISKGVVGTFFRRGYIGTLDGSIRVMNSSVGISEEIPIEIGIALELYRMVYHDH